MALIDFTLSNAKRFYSSMRNPLGGKGLTYISLNDFKSVEVNTPHHSHCLPRSSDRVLDIHSSTKTIHKFTFHIPWLIVGESAALIHNWDVFVLVTSLSSLPCKQILRFDQTFAKTTLSPVPVFQRLLAARGFQRWYPNSQVIKVSISKRLSSPAYDFFKSEVIQSVLLIAPPPWGTNRLWWFPRGKKALSARISWR